MHFRKVRKNTKTLKKKPVCTFSRLIYENGKEMMVCVI
jgi:hypothetical protein